MKIRTVVTGLALAAVLGAGAWFVARGRSSGDAAPPPTPEPGRLADAVLEEHLAGLAAAVRAAPDDAAAWLRLAKAYHVHELFAEAAACYARADDGDDEATVRWLRALALERAERFAEALAEAGRAASLAPKYAAIPATVAGWRLSRGDTDGALADARRAAEVAPSDPGVWIVLASIRHERGEYAEGEALARRALQGDIPRPALRSYAHFVLGSCLRGLGRADEARVELSRGRDGDGRFPVSDPWREELAAHIVGFTLLAHAAHADVGAGRYADALPFLEDLHRRDPKHPQVLGDLGRAYRELGRLDDAARVLEQAVAAHPRLPVLWAELALTRERRADSAGTFAALERGLAESPGAAEILETRGMILFRLGRRADAVADFERAFAADPSRPLVLIHAAVAELESDRVDAAEKLLLRCEARDPGLADAQAGLAIVAARRGDRAEARRRLEASLRLDEGPSVLQEAAAEEAR